MGTLHEAILYPCVRIRAGDAGGSGTVVYSQEGGTPSEWHTYVLTCEHVIQAAVHLKEKWNPLLGRVQKVEERDRVKVEFFHYESISRAIGTHGVEADIVMHDKDHDVALVRLRQTAEQVAHVARLFPRGRTKEIALLDRCYAVGCALGHSPIVTEGRITSMSDENAGMSLWMSDAQIIYGNSGGAIFHGERNELIGIPSRIAVIGWTDSITHMGYFADIERLYQVFDLWCYQFLYDPAHTIESCAAAREVLRKADLELRRMGFVEEAKP